MLLVPVVVVTEDTARRNAKIIRDAITFAKYSMNSASLEAEIDQAQFTRQIEGKEGSLKRLWMLGDEFKRWEAVFTLMRLGWPKEIRHCWRLGLALLAARRQHLLDRPQ